MQIHHDSQASLSQNPDELVMTRAVDFLAVSTFLKPNFRIAVASGELRVQVELKADANNRRWSGSTRH